MAEGTKIKNGVALLTLRPGPGAAIEKTSPHNLGKQALWAFLMYNRS